MTTIEGQNSRAVLQESSVGQAVSHAVVPAICRFISYTIITDILARLVPRDDELLSLIGRSGDIITASILNWIRLTSVRRDQSQARTS